MATLRVAIPAMTGLLLGWSGGHLFRDRASIPATPRSAPSVQTMPAPSGAPSIASLPAAQRVEGAHLAESRDIFRYREFEPKPHHESTASLELTTTAPPVAAPVNLSPQQEPPPQLGYTFIGTFGPDGAPIAAFSHNGEVVIAQPGQRIDEHYRLRSVGLESVDVERADGGAMRVAVGSSRP